MKIDNTKTLKDFLFPIYDDDRTNEDLYYHVLILQRSKDDKSKLVNRWIKSYYIHDVETYDRKIEEIKKLCEVFDARAYINLNLKSFKKSAFKFVKEAFEYLEQEQYKQIRSLYDSVSSKYNASNINDCRHNKKLWMLDIDTKDDNIKKQLTNKFFPLITLETKNGYHMIIEPSNPYEINETLNTFEFADVELKKDALTLLYV